MPIKNGEIMEKLRNLVLLLAIVLIAGLWACSKKAQPIQADIMPSEHIVAQQSPTHNPYERKEGDMDEEGYDSEIADTYYQRLCAAFSGDSTAYGMNNDMDYPDWYSGCFFNDKGTITINVVGDTAKIRKELIKLLGGNDFDLGVGVCSKKTQLQTMKLLDEALERSRSKDTSDSHILKGQGDTINVSMTIAPNTNGTIEIGLYGDTVNAVNRFKKEIFDSPILRFYTGVGARVVLL